MRLNVYLNFLGKCEEALKFYQSALGGEISAMVKVAGTPAEAHYPADMKNNVLHGCLTLDNMDIMASDCPPSMYVKPANTAICINLEDEKNGERIFSALSEDGAVLMPFEQTFFAKKYGMFTDRFGVSWMVHCA